MHSNSVTFSPLELHKICNQPTCIGKKNGPKTNGNTSKISSLVKRVRDVKTRSEPSKDSSLSTDKVRCLIHHTILRPTNVGKYGNK